MIQELSSGPYPTHDTKYCVLLCFFPTTLLSNTLSTSHSALPSIMSEGRSTERVNQVLGQMIRVTTNWKQDDWSIHLSAMEFASNRSVHEATNLSPYMGLYLAQT